MDERLRSLAEDRYQQKEFLAQLFELAVEEQWFDVRHMVQHDMAKAILADYSLENGFGFLDRDIYLNYWEDVVKIGWGAFSEYTGLPMEKINTQLKRLEN